MAANLQPQELHGSPKNNSKNGSQPESQAPDPYKKSIAIPTPGAIRELQPAFERATASIPPLLNDVSIARDEKRKPEERFAAVDRFARVFLKIPFNMAVALDDWLNGGPDSEIVKALDLKTVTLKRDPKTGALVKVDGRGRKRSRATIERIMLAAQRISEGSTKRKMARELFPNLTPDQAYARTRDFCSKHRFDIKRVTHHLQLPPNSSGPSRS